MYHPSSRQPDTNRKSRQTVISVAKCHDMTAPITCKVSTRYRDKGQMSGIRSGKRVTKPPVFGQKRPVKNNSSFTLGVFMYLALDICRPLQFRCYRNWSATGPQLVRNWSIHCAIHCFISFKLPFILSLLNPIGCIYLTIPSIAASARGFIMSIFGPIGCIY
jgi:hypothetical protein